MRVSSPRGDVTGDLWPQAAFAHDACTSPTSFFVSPASHGVPMKKSLFTLVVIVCAAAAAPVVAAPPRAQQLAMACTGSADTAGCAARAHAASVALRSDSAARQMAAAAQRPVAGRESNDGSRFQYDSCGCSN
jgi:hypothetical protein